MSIFSIKLLQNITISIILLILTIPIIGLPIASGLDPSYKYAFNYFFANDIQIGKDIFFSFGPLGFLLFPQAQGNNLLWATVIILLLKFIFIFASFNLYKLIQINMDAWNWIIATFAIYIASTMIGTHDLLIFIPLLLLMIHSLNNNLLLIVLASIIVSIALLTKSSAGIISSLLLSSYMLYLIYERDYKSILIIFISTIMTFLGIWLFLYQNLFGIFGYFYSMLELSKGNSSAMTINPENNWWAFTLFVLLLFSYPLIKREKALTLVYSISLLSSVAYFKYAISREDHINYYVTFLFLLLFVIFLVTRKERYKATLHLSLIFISFLFVSPMISESYFKTHIHLPLLNQADIFDIKTKSNILQIQSDINLKPFKLDNETRKMIANNTVDTYPWDASYISANSLNWKPRPTFQSYITYTSFLDNNNAKFFKSKDAPKYIIWQLKHWGNETGSIDGRYLLNDEPSTLYEILNRYTVISKNSDYLILKRNKVELLSSKLISEDTYQWNQWIDIPAIKNNLSSTFILAKIDINRTIFQKLKKLIYKEFEVYINYKFDDNSEKKYRVVVDTAQNGIWVNPLLNKLFSFSINKKVTAIKLTHNKYDYFEDTFAIQWKIVSSKTPLFIIEKSNKIDIKLQPFDATVKFNLDTYLESNSTLSIRGWAFENQLKVNKATKYIVLKSADKFFVYTVEEQNRPDVTAYFKAKNLDQSGFKANILKEELPVGSYDIYILLIDNKNVQHMIYTHKKAVI